MNISKVNSVPFKGHFIIVKGGYNPKNDFMVEDIDSVKNLKKERVTLISGTNIDDEYVRILIPYSEISSDKISAAYKAAKLCKKADIILKINNN